MKKIISYIAALCVAVSCSDAMVGETGGDYSGDTTFVTLKLDNNDTRLSTGASGVTEWEDGDIITLYSKSELEPLEAAHL